MLPSGEWISSGEQSINLHPQRYPLREQGIPRGAMKKKGQKKNERFLPQHTTVRHAIRNDPTTERRTKKGEEKERKKRKRTKYSIYGNGFVRLLPRVVRGLRDWGGLAGGRGKET